MRTHSNYFKNDVTKLGRELRARISYELEQGNLITEDNLELITEDNNELVSEETSEGLTRVAIKEDKIYSITHNSIGELFRTYMDSFEIISPTDIQLNTKCLIEIGVESSAPITYPLQPTIEYITFGHYYIKEKEYDEVLKMWKYTLYDDIVNTMVKYDESKIFLNNEEYVYLIVFIQRCLRACGITYDVQSSLPAQVYIYKSAFAGMNITYRDALDYVMQVYGVSLSRRIRAIVYGGIEYVIKITSLSPNITDVTPVETIDADILTDNVVKIKEKFGPINSLVFIDSSGNVQASMKDDASILANGETQYVIKNNPLMTSPNWPGQVNRTWDLVKDIEFYLCDIDTEGLMYLEYMDIFNIEKDGNTYTTVNLKDIMTVHNGLKETFTTDKPSEVANEYSGSSEQQTPDASVQVITEGSARRLNVITGNTNYLEINGTSGVWGVNLWASDKRLKKDIKDTNYNALDIINKIRHKEFRYKDTDKFVPIGYIADDLEEIDKNMVYYVGEDKLKYPTQSYLIPILSKAIQEQQKEIELLQEKIEELEENKHDSN